jgi:hypothetical protein
MSNIQSDFDGLVEIAVTFFRASAFSHEERALEEQLEIAKARDCGVAEAAIGLAFRRVAPPGLEWR